MAFADEHNVKPPIVRVFGFNEARDACRAPNAAAADLGKIVPMVAG